MRPGRKRRRVAHRATATQPAVPRPGVGGARRRRDDPLYKYRRSPLTRPKYLTERQRQRLDLPWDTDDDYVALQVTWKFYQEMIAA